VDHLLPFRAIRDTSLPKKKRSDFREKSGTVCWVSGTRTRARGQRLITKLPRRKKSVWSVRRGKGSFMADRRLRRHRGVMAIILAKGGKMKNYPLTRIIEG
jgi:hypothetical protein